MWQVWVSSSMLIFRHVVIYCWRRQYGDSADLGELWGGDDQRAKKHAHMGRCLANLILVDVHHVLQLPYIHLTIKQDGREDLTVYERYWGSLIFKILLMWELSGVLGFFSKWYMANVAEDAFIPLFLWFCWVFYPGECLKFTLKSKIRLGNFWF